MENGSEICNCLAMSSHITFCTELFFSGSCSAQKYVGSLFYFGFHYYDGSSSPSPAEGYGSIVAARECDASS